MKFGKTLLEELSHDWSGSCFDYKGLKKIIKLITRDPASAPSFSVALEAELFRIQQVMLQQEELLRAEVVGLQPYQMGQPLSAAPFFDEGRVAACSSIVRKIKSFKHYASLTSTGVRKIIKKFDKRLQLNFREHYGVPPVASWLVSEGDVVQWLLAPASNCLDLLSRLLIERPVLSLRQYGFWAAHLEHGLQLTRTHIEHLRQDDEVCVRNTFVDLKHGGEESAAHHRRAFSCPRITAPTISPRVQDESKHSSEEQPAANMDENCCKYASNVETPSAPSQLPDVGQPGKCVEISNLAADGSPKNNSASSSQLLPRSQGSSRWWIAVKDSCQLSGFPIAGLPYPPFKFRDGARRSPPLLVDAQYLALSVLATLEFQVLGRALTLEDMQAVDAHTKRCKLGNFRLSHAAELLHSPSPEAARELKALQLRAQKRLRNLQHIQRTRLMRADNQVQI